jgi:hypothetical protein
MESAHWEGGFFDTHFLNNSIPFPPVHEFAAAGAPLTWEEHYVRPPCIIPTIDKSMQLVLKMASEKVFLTIVHFW